MTPIATVDLSARCALRCRHCYYFAGPPARELDDGALLAGLAAERDARGIRSVMWIGGEPLLRAPVLRDAIVLFPRNAVVTSASRPVPPDLDAGLLVSIDGPSRVHDRLRGGGAHALALANLRERPSRGHVLLTTLTAATLDAIDALPQVVDDARAAGALVGFFSSPAPSALSVTGDARRRAVDALLALALARPDVVRTPPAALELFLPEHADAWRDACIYRGRAVALDASLRVKEPCSFGAEADCASCGCPVVGLQLARTRGDAASAALLGELFSSRS